jgi:aryl-alcohol dehydrogenase-like predicted oxidoreductase
LPWHVLLAFFLFGDVSDKFFLDEELNKIALEHDTTVSQTALNYVLGKPGVCSIIIGMRNKQQLEENLKAAEWELTTEEVARLDKLSDPVRKYPYFIYDPLKAGTPI